MKTENFEVGQILELDMQKGKSNTVISRTELGRICLFERGHKPVVGSTWYCEVKEVHDKKLIVVPLSLKTSAAENKFKMDQIYSALKPDKNKKLKVKRQYPCYTKQELLKKV